MPVGAGKLTPWMTGSDLAGFLEPGDLVEFKRDMFQHWAVFVQLDEEKALVVHLSGFNDDVRGNEKRVALLFSASVARGNPIAEVLLSELTAVAGGKVCRINNTLDQEYSPLGSQLTVARALSEIGQRRYNVLTTNCEHFATWCRYGAKSSRQASTWKSVAAAVAVGALSSSASIGLAAGGAVFAACSVGNRIRHRLHRSRSVPWYVNI